MLRQVEAVKGVKKVFIRSGIRFDYLILDDDDTFFRQLVERHTSGQLKVAPEHCSQNALMMMGKPPVEVFEKFKAKFFKISKEAGLEQYLVPYLMSSHPGTTMNDAVNMALWLKEWGYSPEQVQDFYPTPGTISTVMYYTGIHPMTGKSVYVTTDYREKQLQRALLQFKKPENANMVREALKIAGREDLIGNSPECLVRPAFGQGESSRYVPDKNKNAKRGHSSGGKKPAARATSSSGTYVTGGKKTKLDRVFGEDSARIRREAARLSDADKKHQSSAKQKGAKAAQSTKSSRTGGSAKSSSGSRYAARPAQKGSSGGKKGRK